MRLPLSAAGLLLLGVAFAGDPPTPPDKPADPTVAATVNGEIIRLDEVDARCRRRPVADVPLTDAQARQVRLLALDDLIDERLLAQFLRSQGPKLEPGEAERHFAALAEALRQRKRTVSDFAKELGLNDAQLRESYADRLRFEKYVAGRTADGELRKYHAENRDYFDRVEVKVSQIVARVSPTAPPGERNAARLRLAKVRAEIAAGKIGFADAARKYSIDPSSRSGGDIGYIARRDTVVDEAICRAAFALPVGEISSPVDTEFGVHLLLATDRRAGTPRPFEQVADEVRDCYTEDVRRNLLEQLRKAASIQINVP